MLSKPRNELIISAENQRFKKRKELDSYDS